MTKGTGNLNAVWIVVSVASLTGIACTSPQVAPAPEVHLPVAEQRIFVELPTNTGLNASQLRRSYYAGRRTISHVRPRCVLNPPPTPCTETTDVRITAVEGARYVNPGDAPRHPQLIAWIENLGDRVTYDGIEPATRAVYALVVDSLPRANPAIVRVAFPGLRALRAEAQMTPNGHVYKCHEYGQPYISDADYQTCIPYHVAAWEPLHSSSAHAMFASLSTSVSLTSSSDPTWFSCASGCCSAASAAIATGSQPHRGSPHFLSNNLLALSPLADHQFR